MYKVFQLFKGTDHLSKFTVVTKGLTEGPTNYFLIEKSIMVIPKHIIILKVSIIGLKLYKEESLAVTKVSLIVEIIYQSDL